MPSVSGIIFENRQRSSQQYRSNQRVGCI